ncbi:MAG: ABC transporter permease [Nanoarchaeota archaeon]
MMRLEMRLDLKNALYQIYAITVKEIKLKARFKIQFLLGYIKPLISFFLPYIILGTLINSATHGSIGIWNPRNFFVFLAIGFIFSYTTRFIRTYAVSFRHEKFWNTLPALLISPINRYNLLFGIFFSDFLIIMVPLSLVFIILMVFFPIGFISLIFILILTFLISFFLACIGMVIGALSISLESTWMFFDYFFTYVMLFSCLKYPLEVFPEVLHFLILYNPFYYFWDLIRNMWLFGFDFILFNPAFFTHLLALFTCVILGTITGIPAFNYIYKKYGIVGY